LFAHAISARTLQLSKKASKQVTFPLQDKPVFEALLHAPWESLAVASSIDDATRLLIPLAQVLEALPVDNSRGFVLRWKTSCPCCFNELIPEPNDGVTEEEFANLTPKVTKETVILRDCPVLDDTTGQEVRKTIMVHVVTVKPVVSTATASKFKFRSSDGDEHRGYEVIIPPMPTVGSHDGLKGVDEVWQLVRTSESDSSALSFIRIGCLDSLFGEQTCEQTNPESNLAAARRIGTRLRQAASYREFNSRKAPATVDAAITRKGLRASCLRVNRIGGPNGHAGGFFLQDVKAKVCSPFISHCIPRNPVGSVIAWPVARGGCITEIIPFYLSVKMEKGLAVTCPPHCAIPRHGFVSPGTRVLDEFQKDEDTRLLEFLRIFTATVYSGARILRQLGLCFPHLMTSEEAVLRTLCSEESRRAIHSAGALPPSSATRSRTAGERDSYSPGQAVFVTDSNPDSDATWPALIVALARSTGKHFLVKLVGDSDESPPFEIPRSRLLPDASGDVLDRGDDDDVVRASFAANDKLIAERQSNNFLDVLTELGEYTTVFDSIFGHQDSFTHTDGALLENKSSFPQGSPDTSVKMDGFLATGSVPPGALAYPKYKIATLSFALSDVELHCLDKDLHCSPRQIFQKDADKRSRRGAWTREGDDFRFYPEGYAVLDWNSRNNHAGGPHHMRLRRERNNNNGRRNL
jgi:hypothetical protein